MNLRKRTGFLLAMIIFIGLPLVVRASAESDDTAIKSYGSIIYQNDHGGSVRIYAEDIALLQEKLASVPDEIFDPAIYAQTQVREYKDITNHNEKVSERSISENDIEEYVEKEGKENP